MLEEIAQWLIFVCGAAAIAFPIIYFLGSRWRSTAEGKMMMNLGVGLGLIFCLIIANLLTDSDYPGRDYIRIVVYAYLTYAMWRMVIHLLRVQARSRRGFYDRETAEEIQ